MRRLLPRIAVGNSCEPTWCTSPLQSSSRSGSLTLKHGGPLLKERLDPLFQVVAAEGRPASGLNQFKLIGAHPGPGAEAAQFGLERRHRQGGTARNDLGQVHRRLFDMLRLHQAVEYPVA